MNRTTLSYLDNNNSTAIDFVKGNRIFGRLQHSQVQPRVQGFQEKVNSKFNPNSLEKEICKVNWEMDGESFPDLRII